MGAFPLHIDNKSAFALVTNPEMYQKMEYVDIELHWIRHRIVERRIIATDGRERKRSPTLPLTKALGGMEFEPLPDEMRITEVLGG